jgi:hypothetical protein
MNSEKVLLFIILLLGLIIVFSFLGERNSKIENFTGSFSGKFMTSDTSNDTIDISGNISKKNNINHNYDNYNHFSGMTSSLSNGAIFYGPNGGSITVQTESDGRQSLNVKMNSDSSSIKFTSKPFTKKFFGPDDEIAFVIDHNHQNAIKVVSSKGTTIFVTSETQSNSNNKSDHNKHHSDYTKYNNTPNTYYGSTGDVYSPSSFINNALTNPSSIFSPSSLNSNGIYNSSMPPGIPRSQIPPGQEDLYILKSEIVPPVCPACPAYPVNNSPNKQEKCPPCPACARCPEPSFECKKVPNYNAINNDYLPVPVLNDFSTFGM